jgi:hypothetical protein
MKRAAASIAVSILVLLVSLRYPDIPPGRQIYNSLNVPTTDYSVLGLPTTTLIAAIFNGTVYGMAAWLIYTLAKRARTRGHPKRQIGKTEYHSSTFIGIIFAIPGVLSLTFSILVNSQVLAFIGLGLTFWGALFFLVRPTSYVKGSLLDATALSAYRTVDRIMKDLKFKGKAFYVPPYPQEVYIPEHLKGLKDTLVFISAGASATPPSMLDIAGGKFLVKNPEGIFIIPPGLGLLNEFEKEMRTDLTKTSVEDLCETLPQLILENFQLAKEIEMKTENNQVTLKIEDSIFKNLYREQGLRSVQILGCPLASAAACAVAKASGKTVTLNQVNISPNAETVEITYTLQES